MAVTNNFPSSEESTFSRETATHCVVKVAEKREGLILAEMVLVQIVHGMRETENPHTELVLVQIAHGSYQSENPDAM